MHVVMDLIDALRASDAAATLILCAPARGGKTYEIARALEDDELLHAVAFETALDDVTWAAVASHARAFAQRRLVPTMANANNANKRKVFMIDDLEVFVACDRACAAEIKPLAKFCAERGTTLVLACPPELATKLRRDRLSATEIHVQGPNGPGRNCTAAADLDTAVRAVLTGEAGVDRTEEYVTAFGGHMFVDTLAHNAAASCPAAVYLARAARSLASASVTQCQSSTGVDGARVACNLARACAWHGCVTGPIVGRVQFTNSLALCNVYARARKSIAKAAAQNGWSVAEQAFASHNSGQCGTAYHRRARDRDAYDE